MRTRHQLRCTLHHTNERINLKIYERLKLLQILHENVSSSERFACMLSEHIILCKTQKETYKTTLNANTSRFKMGKFLRFLGTGYLLSREAHLFCLSTKFEICSGRPIIRHAGGLLFFLFCRKSLQDKLAGDLTPMVLMEFRLVHTRILKMCMAFLFGPFLATAIFYLQS